MTANLKEVKKELQENIAKGESELFKLQRERRNWNTEREELKQQMAWLSSWQRLEGSKDTGPPSFKIVQERRNWRREREELKKQARLVVIMPAALHGSDSKAPKTQASHSLPICRRPVL